MINEFTITGRMAKEPTERYTNDGEMYLTFCLASGRDRKVKGGKQVFDFPYFIAFKSVARLIYKYIVKGQTITVKGAVRTKPMELSNGLTRTEQFLEVQKVYFDKMKDPADNPMPDKKEQIATMYDGFDENGLFPNMDETEGIN